MMCLPTLRPASVAIISRGMFRERPLCTVYCSGSVPGSLRDCGGVTPSCKATVASVGVVRGLYGVYSVIICHGPYSSVLAICRCHCFLHRPRIFWQKSIKTSLCSTCRPLQQHGTVTPARQRLALVLSYCTPVESRIGYVPGTPARLEPSNFIHLPLLTCLRLRVSVSNAAR
jgi:hypothetical protein